MIETQLCKLLGTSDTFVGRAYSIFSFTIELVTQANGYNSRRLYPGLTYARLFIAMKEVPSRRWWPRFKEIDFRDTGLREVARHTTIISGCFARKNTTIFIPGSK